MPITLRRAEPPEYEALSELALRSKAYWGYDTTFLEACRAELSIEAADVERLRATVAEEDAEIVGFYALRGAPPEGELMFLFVEPARIGAGIGRILWRHCLVTAARVGLARIRIESDPFAESFYVAMGATRVGEAPSRSIPDRSLPLLSFDMAKVPVGLHPVRSIANQVERALADLRHELQVLVPGIHVEHIGATALPDGLTKGDVDVNIRVDFDRFNDAVATLSVRFEIAQPQNWTATFASFSDERRGLPIGIQVTVKDSDDDFLVALRDRLRDDPALRREYDGIKGDAAPAGRDTYWQAKNAFLQGVRLSPVRPASAPDRDLTLQQVRRVIDRLIRDGTAVARSDGTTHSLFPVAASAAEGEALQEWVTREGARRTIEIGLGYGISALFICLGLLGNADPNPRHVVVDPHQATRFGNCGLQFLAEAGVAPLIEHHGEESQTALPRFLSEGKRFDLAFVDGNHRFDGVFLDLVYLGRLVRPGGIVFVDDYQLPSVARATSFCLTNLGWRLEEESSADELHQWAILRTSDAPDTRPFDYYVEF